MAAILSLATIAAGAPGSKAAAPCDLPVTDQGSVVRVVDGETFMLHDGREVRLSGILSPHPQDTTPKAGEWPPASQSRAALAGLIAGKNVGLALHHDKPDRYGRTLAHVFVLGGDARTWVQGDMVGKGVARVFPIQPEAVCVGALLAAEAKPRGARQGLWEQAAYQVRDATRVQELLRLRGTFQIVEGRIVSLSRGSQRIYLNFGRNKWSDFSVVIRQNAHKAMAGRGSREVSLEGRSVRVRGWIQGRRGPQIEVVHPELVEIIAAPATQPQPSSESSSEQQVPGTISVSQDRQ